jgi:N-acetylmuramoyl-L-alanine amidase
MSRIWIDAGHGNSDPGAVGVGGRREADDNLRLALIVERLLSAADFTTAMTRTTNNFTPINRAAAANEWGADLLLSLHRNAFRDPTANGAETWTVRQFTARTDAIAQSVQRLIVEASGWRNRGVKRGSPSGNDFGLLAAARMPAIIAESGFVTNVRDNQIFDNNIDTVAAAIVNAIIEVYGRPVPPPTQPPPGARLFRVQIGAFAQRANAEALVRRARAAGFTDAFIRQD